MITTDWSKVNKIDLYDANGNFISNLDGITDVCVGHTLTDKEERIIDVFNIIPCQSFSCELSNIDLNPLNISWWTKIKLKISWFILRLTGKIKVYRSSVKR